MTAFKRHSPTAQTAYHDLVSLLLDDAASDIRGAPTRREIGARTYWYDRYRLGTDIKERYLGEDGPDLSARIARFQELKPAQDARRKERARLVRLLRGERFLGLDAATGSLVAALGKTGVFRVGGVLVGTNAFLLYEGELGLRLDADASARTSDIDIASMDMLELALEDAVEPRLGAVFDALQFAPVPNLQQNRTWRWRQARGESLVEFLTPSFRDDEGLQDLPALGVTARALHHLEYLIAQPIPAAAVYREGILVKVPRPERFAVHKLIVADRRRSGPDSLKARKDLRQAEILISILAEDRPADLAEAFDDAYARGPRWRSRLDATLKRAPDIAVMIRSCR